MSKEAFIKPDNKTKDKTKVGNYFISNYPPFSFWNEKGVHLPAKRHAKSISRRCSLGAILPCPVLSEALPLLLFSRLHRQEFQRSRTVFVRYAEGTPILCGFSLSGRAQAKVHLLWRGHTLLSFRQAIDRTHGWDEENHALGRSRGGDLRMRTGHFVSKN